MNRVLQMIALLVIPLLGGCRICGDQHGTRPTVNKDLNAQVESILFALHSNTNDAVEADAIAKLDALRNRFDSATVAVTVKAAVNSNRYLIKGRAIGVAMNYLSGPEFNALITPTEDECTNANMALTFGYSGKAETMIEKHPDLIASRNDDGETPLHIAAARGDTGLVKWLIDHGADVNAQTDFRYLPLHLTKDGVTARALVAAGSNLGNRNGWGRTPLQRAAQDGDAEVVSAIIDSGYPLDLRSALWMKDRDRVKNILREGALLQAEEDDQQDLFVDVTPLGLAAQQGDMELVQLLLQAGADPKAKTERPNLNAYSSPLCEAVWGSQTNIVKLLLERGADPNILIEYRWHKWNLLDGAEKVGNGEMIRLLKEHGAVRFAEDPQRQ